MQQKRLSARETGSARDRRIALGSGSVYPSNAARDPAMSILTLFIIAAGAGRVGSPALRD